MVCETTAGQKSLFIKKRGTFFGDPFFRDSWADYNSAVRRIVDRFNHGWINPSDRIRDSQYHSMYRTLRSAKQNYSSHSARFREEADCFKLIMDVHEFVGGDITVRTAGKTVSVRGKVEAGSDGIATLRTEKAKQCDESDASSTISGISSSARTLHRRYTLPTEADCDKIESALSKDAVLTVTVPKRTDVRFIPLTIEGKVYKSDLSKKRYQDERMGGTKRPNDSPLLSSRKKSQEEHEPRENPLPWTRHHKDENKENSSGIAESVSARRSRFEKFLSNNSVDEKKEEKPLRRYSTARERDKYEDAREVTIPIILSDEGQDKIFTFAKENKGKFETKPLIEQKPSTDIGNSNTSQHPLLKLDKSSMSKDHNKQQFKTTEFLNNKTNDLKDKIDKQESIPTEGTSENYIVGSKMTNENSTADLNHVAEKPFVNNGKTCQKTHRSKRERSLDGIVSSTTPDKIFESNHSTTEIQRESSVKSPKLDHQAIPRLSLCKPQLSDDIPERIINMEDNLKPKISNKLDSLDTPKTKHKSPSVTPGGREILIEKRHSLMEDDMFQDCWSDFSNTLQEVLNRLQELSSDLGQSKILANSLTDLQNEGKPPVSENQECMDSKMKESSNLKDPDDEEQTIKSEVEKCDNGTSQYNKELFDHPKLIPSVAQELIIKETKSISPFVSTVTINDDQTNEDTESVLRHNDQGNLPSKGHLSQSQNNLIENNSNRDFFVKPTSISEPVLESKLKFGPVKFDTQTSVCVDVLQPQTSIDLVSEKDLPSTAVSQSSSVFLTDSSSKGTAPIVTDYCNIFQSRLNRNQNIPNYAKSLNTVTNTINDNSESINSRANADKNRSVINENAYKATDDNSGNNKSSFDGINIPNIIHSGYVDAAKQRKSDINIVHDSNVEIRESTPSNISEWETNNRKKQAVSESPFPSNNKESEDINKSHLFQDTRGGCNDWLDTNSIAKDINESHECEEIVDILNSDVMRQAAFSQNGVNSPRLKSSHLRSAKTSARRLDDFQKEKKSSVPQEYCNANSYIANAEDMGSILTRGKDSQRGGNKSQPASSLTSPLLNENTNQQRYNYRKEYQEDVPPVPSYVRQKSQPSKRFTGFANINSNNVRRMRDTWCTKPDKEDSEPTTPRKRSSPSPTRNTSSRTCSPSVDNQRRCRSPSPMRFPMSPKDESYHSFSRSIPSRQRQSFSPNRDNKECQMNPRDYTKRSTNKTSYSSPTFSSSQKTCGGGSNKKTNGNFKCSSQDQKQFNTNYKSSDSPLHFPKTEHKENNDEFNHFKIPEAKRQSDKSAFKPKYEPSHSPRSHQRIFKRFRNANLQPDSEAICFKEEQDRYKMVLDVEEFVPGEVEVLQDDGVLTVKGKVETKDGPHVSVRTFLRTFAIPRNSREEDIDSSLSEDGILTIFVPKTKERIIKIELVD